MTGTLGVALRVLTAEGPAAVRDRVLDRVEEWRRRRAFPVSRGAAREPGVATSILNVLPTRPAPRLGGMQIQLLRRLEIEAEERACALFYPEEGHYRLERRHGAHREALELGGPVVASPLALEDAVFEKAVLRAAEIARATAVHVEGLAGIPPASLLRIRRSGLRIILSLHDFALFCARPNLLEQPASKFCGYCEDLRRCEACLGHHWIVTPDFQRRYRATGAELLASACAVIYPSQYLRSRFLALVPGLDPAAHRVIALTSRAPVTGPVPERERRPVRHVAFVGAVRAQKGALVFEEVVRRLERAGVHDVRWSVFGGGEPALLRRLRRLPGVSVRGYYRAGSLPHLLRTQRVDLALLLSITPESYGLTLDECQDAGVPVIAFDHGAIAERVRAQGGGILVPPDGEWKSVLAALRDVLDGGPPRTSPAIIDASSPARGAALDHLRLYRELGLRC